MKHDTEYPLVASNYNITQKREKNNLELSIERQSEAKFTEPLRKR
jgi:hypothetical protein